MNRLPDEFRQYFKEEFLNVIDVSLDNITDDYGDEINYGEISTELITRPDGTTETRVFSNNRPAPLGHIDIECNGRTGYRGATFLRAAVFVREDGELKLYTDLYEPFKVNGYGAQMNVSRKPLYIFRRNNNLFCRIFKEGKTGVQFQDTMIGMALTRLPSDAVINISANVKLRIYSDPF